MMQSNPTQRWYYRHRTGLALLGILLLAALLRFPRLTQHDVVDDEALMAFRSIGWLDTWFGSMQSPVDLFPTEQWWQKLSFHDHPPLLFFIEHQFFNLFGPTELALRLPFAITGLLVVLLIYLLAREMYGPRGALLSAAVVAVANYAVWLSRVGFQEGLLLPFLILALWWWLKSLNHPRWAIGVGVAVGLAFLTKYSAVVIVPVIIGGYLIYRREIFRSVYFWVGTGLSLLLLSPVIVYNAMLYATRGHFDATLWAMLGQTHPDLWSDYHAYSGYRQLFAWWHWMPDGFGWLLIFAAVLGGATLAVRSFGGETVTTPHQRAARWLLNSLAVSIAIFFALSPGRKQYVGLAIIPVALMAGYWLAGILRRPWGGLAALTLIGVLAVQSVNTQLVRHPVGVSDVTHLPLRPTSYVYGNLDRYLDGIFSGQDPAVTLTADPQLRQYLRRRILHQFGEDHPKFATRPPYVIFDQRMDFAAVRWTMYRRDVYLFQPTMMTLKLAETAALHGADYIEQAGFSDFRLVFVEPRLLEKYGTSVDGDSVAKYLRDVLDRAGVAPETTISDVDGTPAFAVYRVGRVSSLFRPGNVSADTTETAP